MLERPVAEDFGNLDEAGAVHGQVAGRRVPEVMEAEVGNLRRVAGGGQALPNPEWQSRP